MTNEFIRGRDLAKQLAEVMGLDPNDVSAIRVIANVGEPARIEVEFIQINADGITKVLQDYALTKKETE